MKEYRQLPINELSHLVKKEEPDYFWLHPPKADREPEEYELTREGFLDAVWNRIEVVYFAHARQINALPNKLDHLGRVKVMLWIGKDDTPEEQSRTLVHEMTHVDRNSWEKMKDVNVFIPAQRRAAEDEEENIVESATDEFYNKYQSLALLALNHVRLRQTELTTD